MKQNSNEEKERQGDMAGKKLWRLLEKVDSDLLAEAQAKGCRHCGKKLHRGDYPRKPRGGADWDSRHSLCCANEECRKRHTPASVRFLGRRVYVGVVVVLKAAMMHGLKAARVQHLQQHLEIDRRTLERWRQWWLTTFAESAFWRAAKGRLLPPVCARTLPRSLGERFGFDRADGLIALLKFVSPISVAAGLSDPAM